MRLQLKLALFNAFSKIIIITAFVLILPFAIDYFVRLNTDKLLNEKKEKTLEIIQEEGIESFLGAELDSSYGSYNLLKEEFILIEPLARFEQVNFIENTQRIVDGEIVDYRVLGHSFVIGQRSYLLEVGRSISSIGEISEPLQRFALVILVALVLLTMIADIAFTKLLLRPLNLITSEKLEKATHPASFNFRPIKTTTTDFKYLDESINSMMKKIQQAFAKEKEFIANASHELLTPVSILQNKLENIILQEKNVPDNILKKVNESQKTLTRLKNIIKALLLISKVENEQFLKNEEVEFAEVVEEVLEEINIRITEKQINVTSQYEAPFRIKGNKSLLTTMIFNLVNNAIRYNTAKGFIKIRIYISDGKRTLSIEDSGKGIEEKDVPKLFDRFTRFHEEKAEGFGLGLPIVKTIADFHRLRITVRSKPGKGSIFLVTDMD